MVSTTWYVFVYTQYPDHLPRNACSKLFVRFSTLVHSQPHFTTRQRDVGRRMHEKPKSYEEFGTAIAVGRLIYSFTKQNHSHHHGHGTADADVWRDILRLHGDLMSVLRKNARGDETSVTNILAAKRARWATSAQVVILGPNERVGGTFECHTKGHYGWTVEEAALFVLCVKDANRMDLKLEFWHILAPKASTRREGGVPVW